MSKARPKGRMSRIAIETRGRRSVPSSSSISAQKPQHGFASSIARSILSGRGLWVSLALIVANLVVYAPVRHYGFVNYDDDNYVSENPIVSGGLTRHGLSWAFTTTSVANWHPLTWLSHMLDVQFYGLNPGPHHLTNLLFHIANTLLLFGLLYGMTEALGRSVFVAGLFAVHPLHVESVAWVAERKDVLSTIFALLTICAYGAYVRQPRLRRYGTVLLLFGLGLMAKPMLVTLPLLLLLLDFWPLGRVALGQSSPNNSETNRDWRSSTVRLVLEKLPLLGLAASSVVTFMAQRKGGAVADLDVLALKLRAENAVVSYVAYIAKMLWPTRLTAFYPYIRSLPEWWVAGALCGLLGISVAVMWAGRRHPYLPVGWLWYLVTLVPVIGLVQVGDQRMADRYTYFPLIGLFIIVAWGAPELVARRGHRRIVLPTAALIAILTCMLTAWRQVRYWENSTTLWSHALEVTTENYLAHNNLGNALAMQGRFNEAMVHYVEALQIKPDYADAHNNLGIVLFKQGKAEQAIDEFSVALRIKPDFSKAHKNLGLALVSQGNIRQAIAQFSEALRINPDDLDAQRSLEVLINSSKQPEPAIRDLKSRHPALY